MIDLHLHLDGSLSIEDFKYLSKRNGVSLGDEFPKNIYVPDDCKSLEEYLTRFDLPCSLLQDEFSYSREVHLVFGAYVYLLALPSLNLQWDYFSEF
jgi:adenosine deaminase